NDVIVASNTGFRSQTREHYYVVVTGIVLSIFAMGLAAYLLSERILAPIDALTESATRLADDHWKTDFEPSSKDEIAELEVAFVEMAKRIQRFQKITSRQIVRTRRRMEECLNNLP